MKPGDVKAFEDFSSAVNTLVGMLSRMDGPAQSELRCGSHVDTLLGKLPGNYRDSFAEFCIKRGIIRSGSDQTYTLPDLAEWLDMKVQVLQVSRRAAESNPAECSRITHRENKAGKSQWVKPASVYFSSDSTTVKHQQTSPQRQRTCLQPGSKKDQPTGKRRERFKPYCPYCMTTQDHYLNGCPEFERITIEEKAAWIKDKGKCWRCGRGHSPESCTLKKLCSTCNKQHLLILHEVVAQDPQLNILTVSTPTNAVHLDHASHSGRVMLKVVPVLLRHGKRTLNTHAVLDDGSERTVILAAAVKHLGLCGEVESLKLKTIRQDVLKLQGMAVSFEVSANTQPRAYHAISQAFTATELQLAEQSCPGDKKIHPPERSPPTHIH